MYSSTLRNLSWFNPKTWSFILAKASEVGALPLYGDRYLKRLLWYLLGGTRGGVKRAEILKILRERPSNANQLAGLLRVDYKTIRHHLGVLEENGLIASSEKGSYGAVYVLTPKMEEALPIFDDIWTKIGRTQISGQPEGSK